MIFGIFKAVGVVLFLYLTWRNLRDDYKEDQLVAYAWWVFLIAFVVGRATFGLVNWGIWNDNWFDWLAWWQKPGFNYFGGVVGLVAVTWWYCRNNDWKLWAFLEKVTGVTCLSLSFLMFGEQKWIYGVVMLVGFILSLFIGRRYRSFVWYKSGKRGFVFFFVSLILGLLLTGMSWWFKNGTIMTIGYLVLSLISGVGLVMLANDEN